MSKRRIENDIEELEDEVLRDLTAAERRTLTLRAIAEGRDDHEELLRATCPVRNYQLPDFRYVMQINFSAILAMRAVYDLHRVLLHFKRAQDRNWNRLKIAALKHDEWPIEDDSEVPDTETEISPSQWLRELAVYHRGYKRFAEEELDLSLQTWLALTESGPEIVDTVETTLAENESLLQMGSETTAAEKDSEIGPAAIEDISNIMYDVLKESWR